MISGFISLVFKVLSESEKEDKMEKVYCATAYYTRYVVGPFAGREVIKKTRLACKGFSFLCLCIKVLLCLLSSHQAEFTCGVSKHVSRSSGAADIIRATKHADGFQDGNISLQLVLITGLLLQICHELTG